MLYQTLYLVLAVTAMTLLASGTEVCDDVLSTVIYRGPSDSLTDSQTSGEQNRMNDFSIADKSLFSLLRKTHRKPKKPKAFQSTLIERSNYIQADLERTSLIKAIITRGCDVNRNGACRRHVTKYRLLYSLDNMNWHFYMATGTEGNAIFVGSNDGMATTRYQLDCPIIARYVRLSPVSWHPPVHIVIDLVGCPLLIDDKTKRVDEPSTTEIPTTSATPEISTYYEFTSSYEGESYDYTTQQDKGYDFSTQGSKTFDVTTASEVTEMAYKSNDTNGTTKSMSTLPEETVTIRVLAGEETFTDNNLSPVTSSVTERRGLTSPANTSVEMAETSTGFEKTLPTSTFDPVSATSEMAVTKERDNVTTEAELTTQGTNINITTDKQTLKPMSVNNTLTTSAPQVKGCLRSCDGIPNGHYHSCHGCKVFVTCSNGILFDLRPCPSSLVWDDIRKQCSYHSKTCEKGSIKEHTPPTQNELV